MGLWIEKIKFLGTIPDQYSESSDNECFEIVFWGLKGTINIKIINYYLSRSNNCWLFKMFWSRIVRYSIHLISNEPTE